MAEEPKKDPFDGEYIGNIWGWKFSLFGLVVILVMVGLMWYRSATLGVPWDAPAKEPAVEVDSLLNDE